MYTSINFKTKKALKEAVKAGQPVGYYQPNSMGHEIPENGHVSIEGPWYPEPHRWYAYCEVRNGHIVKVD